VADLKNKTARVVKVRLGMKLSEILEAVYSGAFNIFAGGGIMQSKVTEENACVDRNTNFIATGSFPNYKESPQCSGCAVCTRNCPAGLKVNRIADLVEQGKPKEAAKYRAAECISCGSCSYSCLAGRNLAAKVKNGLGFVLDKKMYYERKEISSGILIFDDNRKFVAIGRLDDNNHIAVEKVFS
jgi:Na+-translocating ferredoxin:NAD+ oxidoreductase RnfC subunit